MNNIFANLGKHETKRSTTIRFIIAFAILVIYVIYLIYNYGTLGLYLGLITWSAFVMATPLPDGGLIIDFPIRLLTGVRMVYCEIIVWLTAILLNSYTYFQHPEVYSKTSLTKVFKDIISHPWPNWIIILISLSGTFLGLYFGDELLDLVFLKERKQYYKYKNVYWIIIVIFFLIIFYYGYRYLLFTFGLNF